MDENCDQPTYCLQESHFKFRNTVITKRIEKKLTMQTVTKTAAMAILISNKMNYQAKKEMIKG